MKKLILISLVAVVALALTGCMVSTRNISGRGSVMLFDGMLAEGTFVPGEATFSLNFACYAQNNNRVEGYLNWNDPTNGVRFSAILPETPVKVITEGDYTTCKALKAASAGAPFSLGAAYIVNENGKRVGEAAIFVMEPAVDPCGDPDTGALGTAVEVVAADLQNVPYYYVWGCLDRGKIIFGPGQNQQ